jgi:hypothetical protein
MGLIDTIMEEKDLLGDVADIFASEMLKGRFIEDGFEVIAFEKSDLYFRVPVQDMSKWYEEGKLIGEKTIPAEKIANSYGLEVFQPPVRYDWGAKHHIVFCGALQGIDCSDIVATAHPLYVRINTKFQYRDALFEDIKLLYK